MHTSVLLVMHPECICGMMLEAQAQYFLALKALQKE
jgi:hypothetical protein